MITARPEQNTEMSGSYSSPSAVRAGYIQKIIASELKPLSEYADKNIDCSVAFSRGRLCDKNKQWLTQSVEELTDFSECKTAATILLDGNVNYSDDIHKLLENVRSKLNRRCRVVVVTYNSYLIWLYKLASSAGLRKGPVPTAFIRQSDLNSFALLTNFAPIRTRVAVFFPFRLFGIGDFFNSILPVIPLLNLFALAQLTVLKPIEREIRRPSLTIVIPARNERGNIREIVRRIPDLPGVSIEVIFVEGHSNDGTWEEILRVLPHGRSNVRWEAIQQTGIGKSDAVRHGFKLASNEVVTILDADLSVAPEDLERFYEAYCQGKADFINGSRLLYPMEDQAMKFLNKLGNIFFAKALSYVLSTELSDSLCGTKLLSKADYDRFVQWRNDFGDFDPFGDFELLFPAAELGLGIVNIPVHYKNRRYGATNIRRFRDGLLLLNMTLIGWLRLTLGKVRS